jgi:hypothetical protein
MSRLRILGLAAALVMSLVAGTAHAGWGWGHRHKCESCGYDDFPTGSHWANSYIHGHRIVRAWGGPNHPLPMLTGRPGFWDEPGWFNTPGPYAATTAPASAAGQAR